MFRNLIQVTYSQVKKQLYLGFTFFRSLSIQVQAKNYLFYSIFYLLEINFTKEDIGGYES